jgi:hypothetical protein
MLARHKNVMINFRLLIQNPVPHCNSSSALVGGSKKMLNRMNFRPTVEASKEAHAMQRIDFPTGWFDRKYPSNNQARLETTPSRDQIVTIFTSMLMLIVIFICHILLRV